MPQRGPVELTTWARDGARRGLRESAQQPALEFMCSRAPSRSVKVARNSRAQERPSKYSPTSYPLKRQ